MNIDNPGQCGACGVCGECLMRAAERVDNYTREQRRSKRWGRSAYVKTQNRMLKAMLGLIEEEPTETELALSNWGAAMRMRQK